MELHPNTLEAYQLLHNGTLALAKAEQQGMRIDMEYIEKKKIHLNHKIEKLEQEFRQTNFFRHWQHTVKGTININSNLQLANYLYKVKKIKIEKETSSGQGATDDKALRAMNIPELTNLLEIRKFKKLLSYLELFEREQVDGYIHPFFNLNMVVTFRGSSDHPNFQNIPRRDEESMQTCRRALFPRPGHLLLEADYSGLEVRIAACYHNDPTMIKYITDPTTDMHRDMAIQIFKLDYFSSGAPGHKVLRYIAKNGFVFPQFYGDYYKNCAEDIACTHGKLPQGPWKPGQGITFESPIELMNGIEDVHIHLSDHLISKGISSYNQFEDHIKAIESNFWGSRFPDYAKWKDRWYAVYKKYGYVPLKTGFYCRGIIDKKQVTNYPVQGAAFHCLLWSLIRIDKELEELGMETKIIGQIHDSMLFDVHPDELEYVAEIVRNVTCKDLPEAWKWIIVPLDVDIEVTPIDGSWAEKQKYVIK